MSKEYFAHITYMGAGVWGRSESREKAVTIACDEFARGFYYLNLSGAELAVKVYDSTGADVIDINDTGVYAGKKPLEHLEVVRVKCPKTKGKTDTDYYRRKLRKTVAESV